MTCEVMFFKSAACIAVIPYLSLKICKICSSLLSRESLSICILFLFKFPILAHSLRDGPSSWPPNDLCSISVLIYVVIGLH